MRIVREMPFPTVLLGVSFAAPVINFQISYLCLAGVALSYFFLAVKEKSFLENPFLQLAFWLALIFLGAFGYLHWDRLGEDFGESYRTIEIILIFALLLLVIHAVTGLSRRRILNFDRVLLLALLLAPVFLFLKIFWLFYSGEVQNFHDLMRLRGSHNMLIRLNPNHFDNIAYFLVFTLLAGLWVAWKNWSSDKVFLLALGIPIIGLYAALYVLSDTIGGFTGLICGVLITGFLISLRSLSIKTLVPVYGFMLVLVLAVTYALSATVYDPPIRQAKVFYKDQRFSEFRQTVCNKYSQIGYPKLTGDLAIMPSLTYRLLLAMEGVEIVLKSPVVGHGIYNPEKFASVGDTSNKCLILYFPHLHNFYLDILVRGGALLLAYYILFIGTFFCLSAYILLNARGEKLVLFMPIPIYVVYSVVENMFDLTFVNSDSLVAVQLNIAAYAALVATRSSMPSAEHARTV